MSKNSLKRDLRMEHRRIVKPSMIAALDPVERIVAQQFIFEGRWTLQDGTPEEHRGGSPGAV